MAFYLSIQENLTSILIFWFVFLFSVFMTAIYQRRLVTIENNIKIFKKINGIEKIFLIVLIILPPSLLIGFRNYDVGADTFNLVNGYSLLSSEYIQLIQGDRILFSLFQYLTFIISKGNPTFYLFSMSFLTLFILVKGLEKWANKISLPLAMYIYYALFGMQLLNQARQLIALSIFFYGLYYLFRREFLKYTLCIMIASLVHFTALIGLLFALLYFKKSYFFPIKRSLYYLLLMFSPILIFPFLSIINKVIPSSYSEYIELASYDGAGLGIFITIFPVIVPIILLRNYLKEYASEYLVRTALLTYPLRFAGYYSYFLMRLSYFSSIFMVLLIPIAISRIETRLKRNVFIALVVILLMIYYLVHYVFVNAGGMFPYKFKEFLIFEI